ncbi:phosphatidylserine decarboxylase proenzyme 2 [Selaginella moellendorffii]|uniref:phosphatidylserine decarboxylase proenzyme 2 n=1 Tax=Selaginella moellendorffii TaxID=88036 RepID=UPI000D1CD972|nr:phosphatidylserine decarboxylase proenzyme 2 [Selaginella moellendorffii]XP_024521203.1 phosphatidylserine decarboxylase proenzyme 2 [Selaginella moellendorffii]|eukprot:XP_024521202.1 phosphatidylserine decarboxylase proenzyme 2 [Selaginella moellendorffii]
MATSQEDTHGAPRDVADRLRHWMGQRLGKPESSRRPPPKPKKVMHRDNRTFRAEDFSGIVRIHLAEAEMQRRAKWFACVSIGEQAFRTSTSPSTDNPQWKSEKKVALEQNGPRITRISVFEVHKLAKNTLVGYCEIDLSLVLRPDEENSEMLYLFDPSTKTKTVGHITVEYRIESQMETERSFARRLLAIVDFDENGELSLDEFHDLIKSFGNRMSDEELSNLFLQADENKDGKVSADELAQLLATHKERTIWVKQCPVCGDNLGVVDNLNGMIHMSLCFDEGTGLEIMRGGFITEKQASYGWMFKFSEWANLSTYDVGLKKGSNVAHILVFDRRSKRMIEEVIDKKIALAMRAIYQSKLGLALLDAGTKSFLIRLSEKHGRKMDSPQSAAAIPKFIEFFHDRIDVDEFKHPVEHYKTFNEFFIRELRPGSRPIAQENNDAVAVCGADCRLMVFENADAATRFWIKGRRFSVPGLLGDKALAKQFEGGPIAIFRLAPQDYHRFHVPISGVLGPLIDIPGHLLTVNPIAVNSPYCNVFTDNKRAVCIISSEDFGQVAFVAIGATMVGSITFTKKEGSVVKKGDELGYFSFGGSTCICVFRAGAIDIDKDLLANSERSLETLVSVGMTLGVSRKLVGDQAFEKSRPTIRDSVVALDNEVSKKGIQASMSFNVRQGQLGLINEADEAEATLEEDADEDEENNDATT